jgi:hypothetical protein
MALFTPSQSPAITFREVDLTGVVPNAQSTTGVFVGNFNWGPVRQPVLVSTEAELASVFGTPDTDNNVDYLSASAFLKYSNSLYVIREISDSCVNAADNVGDAQLIRNKDAFDATTFSGGEKFVARYPGDFGNSLKVSYSVNGASVNFGASDLAKFDAASSSAEVHVLVTDEDGVITGTAGTVLETFPFLGTSASAKLSDGTSNFFQDVINENSNYIYCALDSAGALDSSEALSFSGGVVSSTLTTGQIATGFDEIENTEEYEVDFLIAPGMSAEADQVTVVNDLVTIASSTRKDCVVVSSPNRAAVVNAANPVTSSVTTTNQFTNTSYLVVDNNWLKVYDKYNDVYTYIPAASSTAGVMALSDLSAAPWYSPAGQRRGNYLGVTSLAYNATKSQRDTLYKVGVNPIINLAGQGIVLFGDKTKLARPSAFDRINVRRLFLTIERAIGKAAQNVMFEFNDEFTRAEFVNVVEPFLREIKGRRGITDFRVLCDETNNTAAVVDRNEFIASVFVKPARSINYVTLNFVAVRTGVSFDEVVGTV